MSLHGFSWNSILLVFGHFFDHYTVHLGAFHLLVLPYLLPPFQTTVSLSLTSIFTSLFGPPPPTRAAAIRSLLSLLPEAAASAAGRDTKIKDQLIQSMYHHVNGLCAIQLEYNLVIVAPDCTDMSQSLEGKSTMREARDLHPFSP